MPLADRLPCNWLPLEFASLQLIDFDRVEATNLTTQGYCTSDLGRHKVEATADAVQQLDPLIGVEEIRDRYRSRQQLGEVGVLLCGLDFC